MPRKANTVIMPAGAQNRRVAHLVAVMCFSTAVAVGVPHSCGLCKGGDFDSSCLRFPDSHFPSMASASGLNVRTGRVSALGFAFETWGFSAHFCRFQGQSTKSKLLAGGAEVQR